MVRWLGILLRTFRSAVRTRRELALENLALRQQLTVWKARQPRPRLTERDRIFWIVLARLWKNWRSSLQVVRPEMELTRFGGHPMVGAERSVHDAEEPSAVPGGVPTAHHRTGAEGTDARRTGAPVRTLGPGDPELGSAGRP